MGRPTTAARSDGPAGRRKLWNKPASTSGCTSMRARSTPSGRNGRGRWNAPLGSCVVSCRSGPRRVDGRLVSRASTRHADPVTLRPTIRPGAPLLRRDATHLQVGTTPGTVIDDRPGLRSFLQLLNGVRDVEQLRRLARTEVPELEGEIDDLLKPLLACGAVVDASRLHVRRPRLRVALHDDAGGRPLTRA